jgi:hypothetical protein
MLEAQCGMRVRGGSVGLYRRNWMGPCSDAIHSQSIFHAAKEETYQLEQ